MLRELARTGSPAVLRARTTAEPNIPEAAVTRIILKVPSLASDSLS